MKYTASDFCNGDCTLKEFTGQFSPIRLEVGKTYLQESDTWGKKHYKILYADATIAMAICVYNQIDSKFIGDYELFYVADGFKYNDTVRPRYRLTREIREGAL